MKMKVSFVEHSEPPWESLACGVYTGGVSSPSEKQNHTQTKGKKKEIFFFFLLRTNQTRQHHTGDRYGYPSFKQKKLLKKERKKDIKIKENKEKRKEKVSY